VVVGRTAQARRASLILGEDPALELLPVESTGVAPTPAQRAFRDRWLH
jgi:hypothetical protein